MLSGVTPRTRGSSPPIQPSFSKRVICADAELFGKARYRQLESSTSCSGGGLVNQIGSEPPTEYVVEMEIRRRPTVRENHLKAPAQRDGFVPDDTNPGGHGTLLRGPVTLERQWGRGRIIAPHGRVREAARACGLGWGKGPLDLPAPSLGLGL
jgi:hypothetical protein